MPRSNVTASSSSSASYSANRNALPLTQSLTDFELERNERAQYKPPSYTFSPSHLSHGQQIAGYETEALYRHNVSKLMNAKARPFSISGHIPLEDNTRLTVFFRSQVCACLRLRRIRFWFHICLEWYNAFTWFPHWRRGRGTAGARCPNCCM